MKHENDLKVILENLNPEELMMDHGVEFRLTTGSSGLQLNIKECPRCHGDSWKVFLNAETGLGNCFHGACVGEPGFNLYTFTKHFLNLPDRETVQWFKDHAGVGKFVRRTAAITHRKVATSLDFDLPASMPIDASFRLKYLEDRGFPPSLCEYFGWRYCEEGYFPYKSETGENREQNYSGRVIIPVYGMDGKLVTFQGRDVTNSGYKKYLFPPGLPGTGRYLYWAHKAVGRQIVIMNEGVFDVAATHQAFKERDDVAVVGSFGKALSGRISGPAGFEDQLTQLMELKRKGMEKLCIMWDGESSAIKAACKVALELISAGIDTYVAVLPKGKDPNEVSAVEIRAAYAKAVRATRGSMSKLILQSG